MVCALRAKRQNVDFVETDFTGQIDFIVRYSAGRSGQLNSSRFLSKVLQSIVNMNVCAKHIFLWLGVFSANLFCCSSPQIALLTYFRKEYKPQVSENKILTKIFQWRQGSRLLNTNTWFPTVRRLRYTDGETSWQRSTQNKEWETRG